MEDEDQRDFPNESVGGGTDEGCVFADVDEITADVVFVAIDFAVE